jgi:PIN domain nuclease of toxin-antitoxin system
MKALLDTHTFLWWNLNAPQLSTTARDFIADGNNKIILSAASAWEIAIKYAKGRLDLPEPPDLYVPNRLKLHHFSSLAIQTAHALQVHALPPIHNDPFDRLLIVQSQLEKMPLLTTDAEILKYGIDIIW